MKKQDIKERIKEIKKKKQLLKLYISYENHEGTEEEISKLKKAIEAMEENLIKGKNQKKLVYAEKQLNKRRTELNREFEYKTDLWQKDADKIKFDIAELESISAALSEKLSAAEENYDKLKKEAEKAADKIISEENDSYSESCIALFDELLKTRDEKKKAKQTLEKINREIYDTNNKLKSVREELDIHNSEKPLFNRDDGIFVKLEKNYAYRTAQRDYLIEEYVKALKKLDSLNIKLFRKTLAQIKYREIEKLKKEEKKLKYKLYANKKTKEVI